MVLEWCHHKVRNLLVGYTLHFLTDYLRVATAMALVVSLKLRVK